MAGGDQEDGAKTAKPPEVRVFIAKLPTVATEIYGRRDDTAWLDACWAEGAHVASIVAFGGVGKSALVWDWLRGMQRDGWRGAERVYGWSFYSQGTTDRMTSADEFVSAALRWFGDADPNAGSPWDKGERLAGLIRERRTVLVLDGVEPLQWGPGAEEGKIKDPALQTLVHELGKANAGLCVITSRLKVPEAEVFAREKCRRLDLSYLTEEAGAELLRARGVKGAEEELRETVREYGGHSLALALLGFYLEEVGAGDVRRRHEIGPLVEDERLGGHARRVMAAYERMFGGRSVEVAILRMLGLFDRPADEGEIAALRAAPVVPGLTDAAVGIGGKGWNKAVSRLRRVGLVVEAEGELDRRLDAHPLVRDHFGEQARHEREDAWREGHRRLYAYLKGKTKPLPDTIEEMAPLYAAVMHGCRAGKSQEALNEVYERRIRRGHEMFNTQKLGAFGMAAAVLSAFFDPPWERLSPGLTDADQAKVLNEAGFVLRSVGRPAEAVPLLQMGLRKSIELKAWKSASRPAANLSGVLLASGDLRVALEYAQESVRLAEKCDDGSKGMRMITRTMLGDVLHQMGRQTEAMEQFEQAERIQQERQQSRPRLYSIWGFRYHILLLNQGRADEVRERTEQALEWDKEHHWLLAIGLDHVALGRAHMLTVQRCIGGSLAHANEQLKIAIDVLRRSDTQDGLPFALLARADLHLLLGDHALARSDLDEALTLATRCGFRLHETDAHLGYARLHLAEHHPDAALPDLASARKLIEETGYHRRDEELAKLEGEVAEMTRAVPPPVLVTPPARATIAERNPTTPTPSPSLAKPMPPTFAFPPPLVEAYQQNKLAVLFGSGLSLAKDVQGNFPRWNDLPERLLEQTAKQGIWSQQQIDGMRSFIKGGFLPLEGMLTALDAIKVALRGPRKYRAALTAIFRPKNAAPGDIHRALVDLGVNILLTTNYDELLEAVEGPPARRMCSWRESDQALEEINGASKVLFKIHGTAGDDDSVVMTRAEYDKAATDLTYQRTMSFLLQSYTFLLIGYGINDPLDLDLVFALNTSAFGCATRTHYALVKDASDNDRSRWLRELNVQVVPYHDHGDLPTILRALQATKPSPP